MQFNKNFLHIACDIPIYFVYLQHVNLNFPIIVGGPPVRVGSFL